MSDHTSEDSIALGLFIEGLRKACGRTTGHGESCVKGYECGSCADKVRAAAILERLRNGLEQIIQHHVDEAVDSETALDVVLEQAEDEGLWFVAETATEAHLQRALRRLHAAVERDLLR